MKSNYKYQIETCYDIDKKNDIILSIGMIVKNEEKVLERCLLSLQPIMSSITSELIIADTGSSDSTIEIAKKYTDNVLRYEWKNDFADARNSTLKNAKGQWFLFIDADEYFDTDVGEIIHFFKNEFLRSKYRTIEVMLRNYHNPEKTQYSDARLPRFYRIDEGNVEFSGSVHEHISLKYPLGYFSTILHHTGYCFLSEEQRIKKTNRNLFLMREEYRKNPNDLRMLSLLISGTNYEPQEQELYIYQALNIIRNSKLERNYYANVIYLQAIECLKQTKPEEALNLCDEYYKGFINAEKYVVTLGVSLQKAELLDNLGKYEEAIIEYYHYFKLYDDYINDKLNNDDLAAYSVQGITPLVYNNSVYSTCLCLQKINEYDKAYDLLNKFDIEKLDDESFNNHISVIRLLCQKQQKYSEMIICYKKMLKANNKKRLNLVLYMLESTYFELYTSENRRKFASFISKSNVDGSYCELMKLVISQDDSKFVNNLRLYFVTNDNWEDGFSEAIYLALKHKLDISDFIIKIPSNLFRSKLEYIAIYHNDYSDLVLDYGVPNNYINNIISYYWIVCLYEKAVNKSYEMNEEKKVRLYNKFIELLGDYVFNLYNPELLNDDDIEILPELHRFGFYMSQANYAITVNNPVGYIRNLRKALQGCESMKEVIQFMFDRFNKTGDNK